jgi:hypothetical protein
MARRQTKGLEVGPYMNYMEPSLRRYIETNTRCMEEGSSMRKQWLTGGVEAFLVRWRPVKARGGSTTAAEGRMRVRQHFQMEHSGEALGEKGLTRAVQGGGKIRPGARGGLRQALIPGLRDARG